MLDKPWKRAERTVARLLGGERASRATQGMGGPDVTAPGVCCAVKYRASFPAWLQDASGQAREAGRDGRLGVVVLRERGQPGGILLMKLADFIRLRGGR